ncbi:M24 family metallopeptidase [Gluconobacter cerinus]|uniref:M24 family metallopeptidase n=1 Tax=Gluconobacter cerinus TaxID=38307 RepID=UPI001BB89FDD|nr:M24 family metallopeptidase [Gluconobacter cerinus]MBS1073187.1 M24 family metallopeptidase [Gluconobacter cerinus]
MHEEPQVLNFGKRGAGQQLKDRMVFTIKPMINQGTRQVMTKDRKLSAQLEYTVAVTKGGMEILTLRRDEEGWDWVL